MLESQYFLNNERIFQLLIVYFKYTGMGCTVRDKRINSLISLQTWNFYNDVIMDRLHTNNELP